LATRRIIYRPEFDADAERLGGIGLVQRVIDPLVEALTNDPYSFGLLNVATGIRYAATKRVGLVQPLIVTFSIDDDGDVFMESVDVRDTR
jgi:hypothetical protein